MNGQKAPTALTGQQREAVESTARRIVVMAAAGSGKTRVLVERAVHLIQRRGVSAQDVLLVTFTRKAAREIRQRIEERIGATAAQSIWCDTFHAIALRMLSEIDGKKLSVIPLQESLVLFLEVCRDLGFNPKQTSAAKRSMKELTQGGTMDATKLSMTAFDEFGARMNRMNCIDYGMLLVKLYNCHLTGPVSWFRHVLVDEAQDCDAMQWKLVREIADGPFCESLCVVGDPNQTIYEWRGANSEFMDDMSIAPGAHVVTMDKSFRCGDEIAAAAKWLICGNDHGHLSCIESTDVRGTIETVQGPLSPEQQFWETFANQPRVGCSFALHREGVILRSNAFLCRTNCEVDEIDELLRSLGLKTHRAGHVRRLSDDAGFRKAWAILSLAWNHANDVAFNVLVLDGTLDTIDPSVLSYIRETAARQGKSLWATYLQAVTNKTAVRYMIESKIREAKCSNKCMGYIYDLMAPGTVALLQEVVHPHDGTDKLLEAMECIDEDSADIPDDAVYVGTIHGAKGLEFDNVCVVNCELGRFPRDGENHLEAERRLMYVAMTRARFSLVLHYQHEPSMFIMEALPDAV